MTLEPIDRTSERAHLSTPPEGAILTTYHSREDIQAFWTDATQKEEVLMIRGQVINLSRKHFHASQCVINLCSISSRRKREEIISAYLSL